jgi:subtilisin family serine protease
VNRTICCTVLLLFAFGILAQAQVTSEARPITVPFHKPPPAFIQFVPNEMVLKVNAQVADFSSLNESNASATTCDELNHLNVKFKVKSFAREFPDPGVTTLASTARLDLSQYYVVKFGDEFELEEVMEAYAGVACVISAQPIGVHPVYERFPNDPFFSDQWNFYDAQDNDVDATDAWEYETGDATVVLGVLDTGLQYNSGDLGGSSPYINGNVWINWAEYNGSPGIDDDGNGYTDDWIGWDFVNNVYPVWPGEDGTTPDNEPTDFNGHGTHVAGIMGAITNNGYAVAGLAGGWNENPGDPANGVKLMALRIGWSGSYQGQEVGYVRMDFAAQAIYYATNKGATAVNCSWGSSNTGGLGAAVDYAVANGVVVVAAAGNDGDSNPDYLGTREDVINVCATNSNDVKPWWSDYGAWVDVAAPGDNIRSTYSYHYNPNYVAFLSGTSQAAPHVTGEAGMLKSHCDTLSGDQITDLIVTYVDDIDDLNPGYAGLLGSGRINVFKAIDAVYAPDVTVIQPNGGEVLYIGQIYTIIWDATDNVGIAQTRIEYSVDGGESWMHIVDLDGNPGEYD